VSLAEPLVPLLDPLGRAVEPAAVVLVTMLLTYLTLVVGELAPKRIALQRPERWARRAARPLAVISTLTRPAVWLLSKSTNLLVRLAGADPGRQREAVAEEEIRDMIATGGAFRPDQRRILAEASRSASGDSATCSCPVATSWRSRPTPRSPRRSASSCERPTGGRR
jgi:putative hemolysin